MESDNCKGVFALLSDYLNLELPPDACREIDTHLSGCAPCVEFVESLRRTIELCRNYQPEEMPKPVSRAARAQLVAAYEKMLAARKAG
jgi:anti-sigma factor RsiW